MIFEKEVVEKKEKPPWSFHPQRVTALQRKWKTEVQGVGGQLLPINQSKAYQWGPQPRWWMSPGRAGTPSGKGSSSGIKEPDMRRRTTRLESWEKRRDPCAKTMWWVLPTSFFTGAAFQRFSHTCNPFQGVAGLWRASTEKLVESENSGNHLASLFLGYPTQFCYLFIYLFFRATCVAYGSSQARGEIRAVVATIATSRLRSEPRLRRAPQLTAMLDP